jgi:hypothetical protein
MRDRVPTVHRSKDVHYRTRWNEEDPEEFMQHVSVVPLDMLSLSQGSMKYQTMPFMISCLTRYTQMHAG